MEIIVSNSIGINVENGQPKLARLNWMQEVLKLNVSVDFTFGSDEGSEMGTDEKQWFTDRLQACFEKAIAEADIEARVLELMEA